MSKRGRSLGGEDAIKIFIASSIRCYEENSVLIVASGDDPEDPQEFMIVRCLGNEHSATVDDGISFQRNQAEYEASNVITKVILRSNSVEVVGKPEFYWFFGGSSFVVEIPQEDNDSLEISALKYALQNIFSGAQVELVV